MGANTRDATALSYFAGARPKYPYGAGTIGVMNFLVDMEKVKADLGYAIDANNVDIVQMWDIPAMTHILSAAVYLYKPEGAAATITLGDTSVPAGWLASFSINGAVGTKAMTLITDANMITGGKTYVTTDTFDIAFTTGDTDVSVAIFGISLACIFFEFPDLATTAPSAWH
jgi:hypothetical protein